jgi:hypothetical protein
MKNDSMDRRAAANRVSIRAVLAVDGEDVTQALARAGIVNPVEIPVLVGEAAKPAAGILGDGITPNLTGRLEADNADDFGSDSQPRSKPAGRPNAESRPSGPATVMLPAAGGMQPFAPVRKRQA